MGWFTYILLHVMSGDRKGLGSFAPCFVRCSSHFQCFVHVDDNCWCSAVLEKYVSFVRAFSSLKFSTISSRSSSAS